jgi:hypothetical protein
VGSNWYLARYEMERREGRMIAVKDDRFRFRGIVCHATGLKPYVSFMQPRVDLVSTFQVSSGSIRWYLFVISGNEESAAAKIERQCVVNVVVAVGAEMKKGATSSNGSALLLECTMMSASVFARREGTQMNSADVIGI